MNPPNSIFPGARAPVARASGAAARPAATLDGDRPAQGLSAAARRYRDRLGLPVVELPLRDRGVALAERSHRLATEIRDWRREMDLGVATDALWRQSELAALAALPPAELADEWRRRLAASDAWESACGAVRDTDFAEAWAELPQGDFGALGRGVDYTDGISNFHAARCGGSVLLLELLGVGDGGVFLDVLGGDGYLWRVQTGLQRLEGAAARARLITNDCSRHMFLHAGRWGLPTREDATRLSRTFATDRLDGVLFAYGTHHIEGLERAVDEATALLRPGGRVVLHDFFDEGPVGSWFHNVVDPFSKTGHDLPHVGPVLMAVLLLVCGLRDIELYEMADPFVFTANGGSARSLALEYLSGMYGLYAGPADEPAVLQGLVERHLSYPDLGDQPRFEADWSYVPRRAVIARGRRAVLDEPLLAADTALVATLVTLLERSPQDFGVEPEVARWWRDRGRQWGVDEALRHRFLSWAEALGVSP